MSHRRSFYGPADHTLGEAIELFSTREEAEEFLAEVFDGAAHPTGEVVQVPAAEASALAEQGVAEKA